MQWSAAQQETPGSESTGPLCESFTCLGGSQRQLKKLSRIMCPTFSELPNVRLRVLLVLDVIVLLVLPIDNIM